MSPTHFAFESSDGTTIAAWRWDTSAEARGIVQLTHGMGEHIRRYDELAGALNAAGFHVLGQDHRGHGGTAGSPEQHGHLGPAGWPGLVDDIGLLGEIARAAHPNLPLVLLGHSMGSFAAQQFVLDHSAEIDALVLTGTAALDVLEPQLEPGRPLDLAMFNAPFAPARTDFDWLSRDELQVDRYVADPACGFGLDQEAGAAMFVGARAVGDPRRVAVMRRDLPLYIAVGSADPVNAQGALLDPLVERYRAQLTDVTLHVYAGARHEVFNETNREQVVDDLLTWLDRIVPAAP